MLSVWCLVPGNYPTARRLRPLRSLLEDRTIAEKSIDLILSRYLNPEVCDHLAARKIAMVGSDTWGLEPYDVPNLGEPESFAYGHMNLIARRGITNFENLDLDVLSREKAYEFLFTWAPLKLVGATGSPGNPIAAW